MLKPPKDSVEFTEGSPKVDHKATFRLVMTRWLACVAVLALASQPDRALADDPQLRDPSAQAHVKAGKTAYDAADYETASREFEAAYALAPEPVLLYGWAQAQRRAGHCAEAIALYRRFLESDPTEAQIVAGKTGISLCEQAGPMPAHEAPAHEAPAHEAPAHETPAHEAPLHEARRDPLRWYSDPVGGGLTIGGAVGAGVGITFLVLAKHSEHAAYRAEFRDDFVGLLDRATTQQRIGFVGVGVGAALVIGGIARYAIHRTYTTDVVVATTGSSIVVSGRF